jgi:hypothetical protein
LYYELVEDGFTFYPIPICSRSAGKLKNFDYLGFKKELSFSPQASKSVKAVVITSWQNSTMGWLDAVGGEWKQVARIRSLPKYGSDNDILIFTRK